MFSFAARLVRRARRLPGAVLIVTTGLTLFMQAGLFESSKAFAQLPVPTYMRNFYPANDLANVSDTELILITNNCGKFPFDGSSYDADAWMACASGVLLMTATPPHVVGSFLPRRAAQAVAPSDLGLSSGTPYLPFVGNPLVELGYLVNATDIADANGIYLTDMHRQKDCGLAEDFVQPTATTPSTASVQSVTGAQDYLHKLAGLTTTPDVFANGCGYQVLGLPASNNLLLLGLTPGGAAISGLLTDYGLQITITDPTRDTITSSLLTHSQTAGVFSGASLRSNGNLDVVETGLTDPVTQKPSTAVLLSNGDGTFQPAVYYDVAGIFTIDDVNGDSVPDIIVLGQASIVNTGYTVITGSVTTLIGKGDGTFTIGPVSNASWAGELPYTGDFNGDGHKDLLIGGTVLFGSGDGRFTAGTLNTTMAVAADSVAVGAVGDLNKDGKLDVAMTEPGEVALFYGNGDGTFTTGPAYAALPDYEQLTITDIDGDGNPDIVVGTSTGGVYTLGGYDTEIPMYQFLMGRGDGTFVDSLVYTQGSYGLGGPGADGPQIADGDFNGDGKADVLVMNGLSTGTNQGSLVLLPGDGKGNLGTGVSSPLNVSPTELVAAEMNGDGKLDAVMVARNQLAVLINQGNGTFAGEKDYALPSGAISLAVGDFNGDGMQDVAVGVAPPSGVSGTSGVVVLLGQADGTLGSAVQIDSSVLPTGLAAASLTGDGRTDLVVADQGNSSANGALHVYLGKADGTFSSVTAPMTTAASYSVAALTDLNNDGKVDLIVTGIVAGNSSTPSVSNIYTLLGNGDGTFKAANVLPLGGADGAPTSIVLGDFNHSGNMGVAVGNPNDYTEVLLGNGDGTLTDSLMALGQRPTAVGAADLLGNGFPALLVGAAGDPGTLTVFVNTTAWTTSTPPPTPAATTTALTASAATITAGASVTLTATVTGPSGNTTTPTGTVTFLDGTATLGTGMLNGSGVATYATTTLSTASHSITASYGGDSNFAASTSSVVTVTVQAPVLPSFSVSASPASLSLTPGQSTTATLTVTPAGGFAQAVSFACSGLPSEASCSFAPATVTPGATAVTTVLTIQTTQAHKAGKQNIHRAAAAGGLALAGLLLLVKPRTRLPAGLGLWVALLMVLGLGAAIGCGGGGSSSGGGGGGGQTTDPGTPAGTSTVTVTATAGSLSEATKLQLTVQ